MCLSTPKVPEPMPVPPPPQPPAPEVIKDDIDEDALGVKEDELRKRRKRMKGFASTVLASNQQTNSSVLNSNSAHNTPGSQVIGPSPAPKKQTLG